MGISLDHCSCFNVLLVSIRYRFLAITLTWLLTCDGTRVDISEEKFLKYFWWCWNKLQVHVQLYSFPYGGATLCWMNRSTMKQIYLVSSCYFHCKKLMDDAANGFIFRRRLMMIFPCHPISGSSLC
jgi:hypothetical protein